MSKGSRRTQSSNLDGMEFVQESERVPVPLLEGGNVALPATVANFDAIPLDPSLLGVSEAGGLDETTTKQLNRTSSEAIIQRGLVSRLWRRALRIGGNIGLTLGVVVLGFALYTMDRKDEIATLVLVIVGLILVALPLVTPKD